MQPGPLPAAARRRQCHFRRATRATLCVAVALAACGPAVVLASAFEYALEHEGRAVGTIRYEYEDSGDHIRTRESLEILLQSSIGRQLLRMDREWEETSAGRPLRFSQRIVAGTATQSLSARVRDHELIVTRRLGDSETTTRSAVPTALVFPAALAARIEAQAAQGEWVLRYQELAMGSGTPELVELRARAPIDASGEAVLEKREADCGFHAKPGHDSAACRATLPRHAGPPFRACRAGADNRDYLEHLCRKQGAARWHRRGYPCARSGRFFGFTLTGA